MHKCVVLLMLLSLSFMVHGAVYASTNMGVTKTCEPISRLRAADALNLQSLKGMQSACRVGCDQFGLLSTDGEQRLDTTTRILQACLARSVQKPASFLAQSQAEKVETIYFALQQTLANTRAIYYLRIKKLADSMNLPKATEKSRRETVMLLQSLHPELERNTKRLLCLQEPGATASMLQACMTK